MALVTVMYSLRANNFNTAERTTAVDSHGNGLVLFADCLSNVCINKSSLLKGEATMYLLMLVVNLNFSCLVRSIRSIIDDRRSEIDILGRQNGTSRCTEE